MSSGSVESPGFLLLGRGAADDSVPGNERPGGGELHVSGAVDDDQVEAAAQLAQDPVQSQLPGGLAGELELQRVDLLGFEHSPQGREELLRLAVPSRYDRLGEGEQLVDDVASGCSVGGGAVLRSPRELRAPT
ncbi:hypothetical protein GCM10023220_35430 [Streptomyces ziwulingensis]|uniref:Uncharacterized protein n=1 Tax=Streptomyces ziwulingensis TaxID=1045501 RepID=A0ABP9C3T2_9ACTN